MKLSPFVLLLFFALNYSPAISVKDQSVILVALSFTDTLESDVRFANFDYSAVPGHLAVNLLKFGRSRYSKFCHLLLRGRNNKIDSILLVMHEAQVRIATHF